jgi:hypothetical protein
LLYYVFSLGKGHQSNQQNQFANMAPKRTLLLESKASALAFGIFRMESKALAFGIQSEVTYRNKRGGAIQHFSIEGLGEKLKRTATNLKTDDVFAMRIGSHAGASMPLSFENGQRHGHCLRMDNNTATT